MSSVIIMSGPVRSGKTTRLAKWANERRGVAGLLSPDWPAGRTFVDLATNETMPIEHPRPGEDVVSVGRWRFRAAAFAWANDRLAATARSIGDTTIVIDEVGPLELRGEGLLPGVRAVLARSGGCTVIVVRSHLVGPVVDALGLAHAAVTSDIGSWQQGQRSTRLP